MAKVTTKKGDEGFTDLRRSRVPKTDPAIKLLGALDKLNVMIGVYSERKDHQNMIYRMSAVVAGFDVPLNDMSSIEEEIASHELSRISNNFVMPTSPLHLVRVQIREVELLAWELEQRSVARLLNRLSDLYFILAELGG